MMAEEHSVLTQHSTLPLAETASVFAEMVMNEQLLAEEKDPLVRREILAASVDDIYATVLRQAFFVIFENTAHQAIQENASPQDLNRLYLENLQEQFGDSVEVSDEFQYDGTASLILSHTLLLLCLQFRPLWFFSLYRAISWRGCFKPAIEIAGSRRSARPAGNPGRGGI